MRCLRARCRSDAIRAPLLMPSVVFITQLFSLIFAYLLPLSLSAPVSPTRCRDAFIRRSCLSLLPCHAMDYVLSSIRASLLLLAAMPLPTSLILSPLFSITCLLHALRLRRLFFRHRAAYRRHAVTRRATPRYFMPSCHERAAAFIAIMLPFIFCYFLLFDCFLRHTPLPIRFSFTISFLYFHYYVYCLLILLFHYAAALR